MAWVEMRRSFQRFCTLGFCFRHRRIWEWCSFLILPSKKLKIISSSPPSTLGQGGMVLKIPNMGARRINSGCRCGDTDRPILRPHRQRHDQRGSRRHRPPTPKTGTGTLNATNTFTGAVAVVEEGTLNIAGTLSPPPWDHQHRAPRRKRCHRHNPVYQAGHNSCNHDGHSRRRRHRCVPSGFGGEPSHQRASGLTKVSAAPLSGGNASPDTTMVQAGSLIAPPGPPDRRTSKYRTHR